jgi:hypothetical protein
VLYNGPADYPDEIRLKLSDSFADLAELGYTGPPDLELTVRMLNINKGHNDELVRRSKTLHGYSEFIGKAREYEKELGSRDEGVKAAVKHCISRGILKEFLELHSSEVVNMLFTEWNWDDALAVRFEEGREEGWEQGREEGWEQGREEGWEQGREEGWEQGREEGWEQGREKIARNALAKGLPLDIIKEITGLDIETIRNIGP